MLYQRVPSRQVPICPFQHFCCRMYRLARPERNESKKTQHVSFLRHTTTRTVLLYSALFTVENLSRSTSQTSVVTLEWIVWVRL